MRVREYLVTVVFAIIAKENTDITKYLGLLLIC